MVCVCSLCRWDSLTLTMRQLRLDLMIDPDDIMEDSPDGKTAETAGDEDS